jgi:hypothetical protein
MEQKKAKRNEREATGEQKTRKEEGARVGAEVERRRPEAFEAFEAVEAVKSEPNQPEPSGEQEDRRSSMIATELNTEQLKTEYTGMVKSWKDGYLQGLDACLQWQAENERLIKDSVKQGLSGSRQFLTWWKEWIENQAQRQEDIQQRQVNVPNPVLGFTKQGAEAVMATVEPFLKNSEQAFESSFGYYENAVATPSRKYIRDINKQVLNAVIPS